MLQRAIYLPGSVLTIALAIAYPVKADTITFNDLTETLTVTGPSRYQNTINGESVTGTLSAPAGMVLGGVVGPNGEALLGEVLGIFGGDEGLSDEFYFPGNAGGTGIAILFASDPDFFGAPTDCQGTNPCKFKINETGALQTAATINWFDPNNPANSAQDIIRFASDVPEPASILMLLTVLMALGISMHHRWRTSPEGS